MRKRTARPKGEIRLLNVRITECEFAELQKVAASRSSSNVSDVVREAVAIIAPSGDEQHRTPVQVSSKTVEKLVTIADELNRSPSKVAEECVLAVFNSLQYNRNSLIVEELKLRRQYRNPQQKAVYWISQTPMQTYGFFLF